jgi:hypothetical protein
MAAKPLDQVLVEDILIDWRLGQLSQRQIAEKRGVSNGVVAKITKGVDRDVLPVNRGSSVSPSPSFIYIITAQEFHGVYKIGLTNSIERRLLDMQTGCPYLLFALRSYEVENPVAVELMLHSFFHKKRLRGEWFKLDAVDMQYIDDAMNYVDEVLNGEH